MKTPLLLALALISVWMVPAIARAELPFEMHFPQDASMTHFTDSFGAARAGHRHAGNDLMAPKLTEVYSIADGVVTWIRDRGTAGRYVAIEHEDGWASWYMHLNNDTPGTDDGAAPMSLGVAVEVGEEVEAGQLIGWVGDSGNAEGSSPHTHFELHSNGRAIDPYAHLVAAYERAIAALAPTPPADIEPF